MVYSLLHNYTTIYETHGHPRWIVSLLLIYINWYSQDECIRNILKPVIHEINRNLKIWNLLKVTFIYRITQHHILSMTDCSLQLFYTYLRPAGAVHWALAVQLSDAIGPFDVDSMSKHELISINAARVLEASPDFHNLQLCNSTTKTGLKHCMSEIQPRILPKKNNFLKIIIIFLNQVINFSFFFWKWLHDPSNLCLNAQFTNKHGTKHEH